MILTLQTGFSETCDYLNRNYKPDAGANKEVKSRSAAGFIGPPIQYQQSTV